MAYTDPLLAMSDALYDALALDSTLSTLAAGGVHFDVPQDPSFPLVYLRVQHDRTFSGYNAQPGRKSRPGIFLRVHVFQSDYGTIREAQQVMSRIVDLLWNDADPLTANGYEVFCGRPLPEVEELTFEDEELRGIKVKELVLQTSYILEELV